MLCEPILSSYPTFSSNTPESVEAHPSPRVRRNLGVGYKASAGAAAIGRSSFKVVGGLIDPLLAFLFRLLKLL